MFPSVPNVHRDLDEDIEIEGHRIPKGVDIKVYACVIEELL